MITYFTKTVNNAASWDEIKEHEIKGQNPLMSGDQIPIILKNGECVTLVVGHDENGKTYFCFEDCLVEERPMNKRNTNAGGWKATDIRKWLNSTLFALLPDDLQKVIVPTRIIQVLDGERVETEDKLFLFSKTQMFGKGDWSNLEPEDMQIDIYSTEKSRVKECGENGTWWYGLRTPYGGSSNGFCSVNSSGYAYSSYANNGRGVAPGFCITES